MIRVKANQIAPATDEEIGKWGPQEVCVECSEHLEYPCGNRFDCTDALSLLARIEDDRGELAACEKHLEIRDAELQLCGKRYVEQQKQIAAQAEEIAALKEERDIVTRESIRRIAALEARLAKAKEKGTRRHKNWCDVYPTHYSVNGGPCDCGADQHNAELDAI